MLAPEAYSQIKNLIEKTVASGLIYLNSHVNDFKNPALRPYLDEYMRGSGGIDAVGRVKLMKLLWDAIGSEFGGRHELYEINYSGSHQDIHRYALFGAMAAGTDVRLKQFVEKCMAEMISTAGLRRTSSTPISSACWGRRSRVRMVEDEISQVLARIRDLGFEVFT